MLAKKVGQKTIWVQVGLLGFWIVIGLGLRFANLESKPPWADEWATLVFSLGHSFRSIPLDRPIDLDTMLLPLQLDGTIKPGEVIQHLMKESTHPPVYFVLTNLWLGLFGSKSGLVSVGLARALSAWLGVVSIPAMFALGWLLSRSLLVAQFAAGLMAVSPYGVYLAQEARHYTLAILLIMASLACLIVAVRHLDRRVSTPIAIILIWIGINSLGVATHYFFGLALVAEILVLSSLWIKEVKLHWGKRIIPNNTTNLSPSRPLSLSPHTSLFPKWWRRIGIAIAGTVVGCSGWLLTWQRIPDSKLTEWVESGDPLGSDFLEPIGRLLAWIVTMFYLLPIEGTSLIVVIISIAVLLVVLIWLMRTIWQSIRASNYGQNLNNQIISKFSLGAVIIVLMFAYLLGKDLTLAARFQFFYFPAIILLIATIFALIWQTNTKNIINQSLIITSLLLGLLGSMTVINNYGYQKPDRPDLVVPKIIQAQQISSPTIPVLIATVHKTHEQTGEMMGIAWEFQQKYNSSKVNYPRFLLLHKDQNDAIATQNLEQNLNQLPRPLDIWLVNFTAPAELEKKNCTLEPQFKLRSPGYNYRLYHCL